MALRGTLRCTYRRRRSADHAGADRHRERALQGLRSVRGCVPQTCPRAGRIGRQRPRLPPCAPARSARLHELRDLRARVSGHRVHDLCARQTGAFMTTTPVLMKGNEAIAEAAIRAGCDAYFGYPITPQAEVLEWMARRMPELGRVFIQAESELAAINMALGAAAAGARVLVSSSSPGISLMAETMSYLAGSKLPCVLINVMRGGPGLGSIGPSQSDYFQATRGHGHGDYRVPVLAPASIAE